MTPITHAISLARKGAAMSHAERGELASLLARTSKSHSPEVKAILKRLTVNIGSTGESGQLTAFLYRPAPEGLGLPPIYIKEHGRNTDRLACDTNALLHHWRATKNPCLKLCLDITNRATQLETLAAKLDPDGRLRWSVTIDGTETGRQTTRKSPTGSGYNLHATAETHKHLIRADPGNLLGWVDLNGADGWTIAAECAQLGDPTMLEDLRARVKPAQAVALLYHKGVEVNRWIRDDVKAAVPLTKDPAWLYPACKKVIWGTCVTSKHDVLTPYGWQRIGNLPEGWPIATWKDGCIRWQVPKRVIHLDYTGRLYRFVGNAYDLEATEDHRMPHVRNGKTLVLTAAEMCAGKAMSLPMSGSWQEGKPERMARLIAAIQSDGHYTEGGQLVFTLRKERKIARLRGLLKSAGIRFCERVYWSKRDKVNEARFYCYNAPVVPKLAGPWMLAWDRGSLKAFVDEYPHWDGHDDGVCRAAFSVHKEHLMWLGLFQRLTGGGFVYQGSWDRVVDGKVIGRPGHRLTLNNRAFADRDSMTVLKRSVTDCPVHCVETDDGFFLVRRHDKIMVTGNCYGMKERRLSEQILEESYKEDGEPLYVEPRVCKQLQELVHQRYPGIRRRQQRIGMLLDRDGFLRRANGSRRDFFGRKDDDAVLREAYADHPQVVTTWVTELAWERMWYDPENVANGERICSPRLLVHDSIVFEFPADRVEWVRASLRRWFENPVTIAGVTLVVPYSGHYGPSWCEKEAMGAW